MFNRLRGDFYHFMEAAKKGDQQKVEQLLKKHPDYLNRVNGEGRTALYYAVKKHDKTLVEYLISKGVDPDVCYDKSKYPRNRPDNVVTPLKRAIMNCFAGKDDGILRLLLEAGADPNYPLRRHMDWRKQYVIEQTPFDLAYHNRELSFLSDGGVANGVLNLLIMHGAVPSTSKFARDFICLARWQFDEETGPLHDRTDDIINYTLTCPISHKLIYDPIRVSSANYLVDRLSLIQVFADRGRPEYIYHQGCKVHLNELHKPTDEEVKANLNEFIKAPQAYLDKKNSEDEAYLHAHLDDIQAMVLSTGFLQRVSVAGGASATHEPQRVRMG